MKLYFNLSNLKDIMIKNVIKSHNSPETNSCNTKSKPKTEKKILGTKASDRNDKMKKKHSINLKPKPLISIRVLIFAFN